MYVAEIVCQLMACQNEFFSAVVVVVGGGGVGGRDTVVKHVVE